MALVLFTLPVLGAVTLGESIAVLGTVASFLMNKPHQQQPVFKAMTSCWGDPWPIVYNAFRVAGKVIQASPVRKHRRGKNILKMILTGALTGKKGPTTFSQTLAIGVCEGARDIGRIWADGTVIYDPRPITAPPAWQANTSYAAGDQVQPTAGGSWQFTATITAYSGVSEPSWNSSADAPTADGSQVWIATPYKARIFVGQSYNYSLRIYRGTESQLPDTALEELVGVGNQSAYRGLVYIVLELFDLSKYGNRIPNFEIEILHSGSQFVVGAEFYGAHGSYIRGGLMVDGARSIYAANTAPSDTVYGIQTGTSDTKSSADVQADAISLGCASAPLSAYSFDGIGGTKYVMAHSAYGAGPAGYGYIIVLYETDTFGILTAVGCRTYEVPFSFGVVWGGNTICTTIRTDTKEVMVAFGDIFDQQWHILLLDTIASMIGGYLDRAASSSIVTIAEITGLYATSPGPFNGYIGGFVGNDLYIALNKGHMDWLAVNVGGVGFNSFYKTLQPAHPNGVMLKVSTTTPGAGILSYLYEGPVTDFSWPFTDEGKNFAGAAGQTGAATYDVYSPPTQSQDINGVVSYVSFARGYSDADGIVGLRVFDANKAFVTFQADAPFDPASWGTAPISLPHITVIDGAAYLQFISGGTAAFYAKLGAFDASLMTLEDICIDVSGRIGLVGKYNYSELANVIPRGAAILNRQKAREFLEAIMPAYFYDLTDIGPQVIGTLRANSTLLVTVPENDLAAATDPSALLDKINSTRSADLEIPRDMSISYYDYNHDYQAGAQPDRRSAITQYSNGSNSLTIPVVMTPGEAANVASRVLYQIWIERTPRKASLPLDYIYITPADIIDFTRDGEDYRIRVTKARFNPSQVIDIEGVSEDMGVYNLTAGNPLADIATGSFTSQTIVPIVTPVLAIMDTAPLRDSDLQEIGTYAAGAPAIFDGGFDGVSVQASEDNLLYSEVGAIGVKSVMGIAASVLGDCPRWTVWDRVNTIDVQLYDGVIANASEADMIDTLVNLCWTSTGEIFQFKTRTLLSGHTYRLSTLLRGRFGTESFTASHAIGEKFVMIDIDAGADIPYAATRIGQALYWKGVNDAATTNETTPELLTMTTRRLMPFAPYFLRGARDGSNNLTITGLRRMRWRGRPLWTPPETDLPVTMEIDVYNGLTVVRTLTATLSGGGSGITDASAFTAYYSAADQTADFGSPQASVSVIAYQLNSLVGRGYGGTGTL